MFKKKIKCIIVMIIILIITLVVMFISKKNVNISMIFGNNPKLLEGVEDDNTDKETYNTFGEDSANYIDGDTNGEKSRWVKDGDIWTYTFYVDDPNAQWYIWEDSETLMEGFSGDYTESNVGTIFTEETLNEFTPNDSIMQSKVIDGKMVYTWFDNENAYKVTDNGNGSYTKVTTKLSFTITNIKEGIELPSQVETGSLVINKIVKDCDGNILTEADDSTRFQFTITLYAGTADSALIEGTKVFGNVVFKNRVAKIALKAGESIRIPDLPEGVTYSITETAANGYDSSYDSNNGTITKDIESISTFTNTKQPIPDSTVGNFGGGVEIPDDPEQKYIDITIKKSIIGNNEVDEKYTIEIEFNNLSINRIYELSDGTKFKSDSQGSANVSVELSNNQFVIIKDIPVGAKYKVFEYAGDYITSYVITDANNLGLINNTSKNNTRANTALATNTETADDGEDITITFINKRTVTQNLRLEKVVTDSEDDNSYIFDIEFGNMEENTSFNSTVGKITAETNGKAELTVYLQGGENVEFYEIPVGTTYRVKELASSAIASYTIIDGNGGNKIERASNSNTKAKKALTTEIETVNQGEEATITFINDTLTQEPDSVEVGLGLKKVVVDNNEKVLDECNEEFTFELTADDETNPMPEKKEVKIIGNGEANFGTITFDKVGTYIYTVNEKAGTNKDCKYDTVKYTITYEVTNPEGLLEITKTVKKDGFVGDNLLFVNKITKKTEEKPIEEKESGGPVEEVEEPEEKSIFNINTGDNIIKFAIIFTVSFIILAIIYKTKKKNI